MNGKRFWGKVLGAIFGLIVVAQWILGILVVLGAGGGAIVYLAGNKARGTELLVGGAVNAMVWLVLGGVGILCANQSAKLGEEASQ